MFLHVDSEDSDQTGRSESLLGAHSFCWFCHVTGRTLILMVLSCRGSFVVNFAVFGFQFNFQLLEMKLLNWVLLRSYDMDCCERITTQQVGAIQGIQNSQTFSYLKYIAKLREIYSIINVTYP